ncbi:hypothetical protein ACH9EU_02780 [Kocuria sp. M1R5S2]|uniref:hypothetical protein n=1 Tax=Kocuria rhizosphaerae TaxID=3376285 RepID=UPI0037A4DBB0
MTSTVLATAGSTGRRTDAATDSGAPSLTRDPLRIVMVAGTAASVVLHGHMALAHGGGWAVLMAAMAVLCLACLAGLLRGGRPDAAVRMTTGMALAMALGHVLLLPLMSGDGAHAHHAATGSAAHPTSPAQDAAAGHGGMLLVVAVELAVAACAVAWSRRHEDRSARRETYRSV